MLILSTEYAPVMLPTRANDAVIAAFIVFCVEAAVRPKIKVSETQDVTSKAVGPTRPDCVYCSLMKFDPCTKILFVTIVPDRFLLLSEGEFRLELLNALIEGTSKDKASLMLAFPAAVSMMNEWVLPSL